MPTDWKGMEIGPPPTLSTAPDADLDPITDRWKCPECGADQSSSVSRCVHCKRHRPAYAQALRKATAK
jgi:predicted RNA-binding Zn-ribbon protein involved in translation (DUF1610 family)